MSENTKINASLKEKVTFLILTYLTTSALWVLGIFLCSFFTGYAKDVPFWQQLSNADIYKVIIIFLVFLFIGRPLDRLPISFNPFVLLLRFICVIAIMICINIRWEIDPLSTEFWSYSIKIVGLLILAQTIRLILLVFYENKKDQLKSFGKILTTAVFFVIIGLVAYFIFTIPEREENSATVLAIDEMIFTYLKYPLLFILFIADYAFSQGLPGARSIPFHIFKININEPLKGSGIRLQFLLFIYFTIAGTILSEALLS